MSKEVILILAIVVGLGLLYHKNIKEDVIVVEEEKKEEEEPLPIIILDETKNINEDVPQSTFYNKYLRYPIFGVITVGAGTGFYVIHRFYRKMIERNNKPTRFIANEEFSDRISNAFKNRETISEWIDLNIVNNPDPF